MGTFQTFVRNCGLNESSGIKEIGRMTYISELSGFPATRYVVNTLASDPVAVGDKYILDEAWDFSAAAIGLGYWREFPILMNTGSVNNTEEGEVGGKDITNDALFFIPGNSAEVKESVACLRAASGCGIFMFTDKSNRDQVVGSIEFPAYFEIVEASGTGGEKVGYAVRAYSMSGDINMEYDSATHGIDVTPNV